MTVDAFVAARRERWAELEAMLARARRGRLRDIPTAELERFGLLCRSAASDLAIARRDQPDSDAVTYLNGLCARARPMLHRSPPARPGDMVRWLVFGIPRAFRHRWRYVLLSFGLMFGGAVVGWLAVDLRPDLHSSLVPASGFDQLARGQVGSLPNAPLLGTIIITNNIKVAAICFLGGFAAAVPTAIFLAANGWMLGTLAAAVHQGGYDLTFWSLIVPHGILELSILIIAGAAGLCVGDALLRPGLLSRGEAFTRAARGTLGLVAGSACLLVVSGILEAYVSPSSLPPWSKLVIGAAVGGALYAWLLLTGRRRRRPPTVRLDVAAAGSSASPA